MRLSIIAIVTLLAVSGCQDAFRAGGHDASRSARLIDTITTNIHEAQRLAGTVPPAAQGNR